MRFGPVLELVLDTGRSGHLLDVGSGSEGISSLLPRGWSATAVDANFDDYAPARPPRRLAAHQRLGDVRALPFEDSSFTVVTAVDLLEHLAPEDRATAVAEICRVSRSRAVIACPAGADALEADRQLADGFAARGRPVPGWLAEHIENGFPRAGEIASVGERFGTVRVLGNENIDAHAQLIRAEHRLVSAAALRVACRPLERMMTARRPRVRHAAAAVLALARGHDAPPTYRTIVVVDCEPAR